MEIYDSTLRDGAQAVGISFSPTGKITFAHHLDEMGVAFLEGGYAGSNPADMRFFEDVKKEHLRNTKIVAFGSTRRAGMKPHDDPFTQALLRAETEYCAIYGKTWMLHVREVLRTDENENEAMIAETVAYLRGEGRRVIFDAEHFFDGFKDNADFAMRMLRAAADAGAETLALCDTNGGSLPHEIYEITRRIMNEFSALKIGIHTHNDSGLAVANALEAVRAGATQVQGCVNGYGERSGNCNLTTLIPNLELKTGRRCVAEGKLKKLRALSLAVDDLVNQRPDIRAPFVGEASFSHKAGAHVSGVRKNPASFEHVPPEAVGNERQIVMSELSGAANVLDRVKQIGGALSDISHDEVKRILGELKDLEGRGYSFESADGSFQILAQKTLNLHKPFFNLKAFRVTVEKRGTDEACFSEATIKVEVDGEEEHTVGEGSGPVEALDRALRKALARFYPTIKSVRLTDFRVRILDPGDATAAVTRVVIESTDGARSWGTVGVSPNIIEASWQALVDSVEYKLYADEMEHENPIGEIPFGGA
ncbi:MAG: citramalate synthase [Kiritimatiellaeota bacterium]|nr:citramalate synthase [Kiritimatiellota bacterium]